MVVKNLVHCCLQVPSDFHRVPDTLMLPTNRNEVQREQNELLVQREENESEEQDQADNQA